MNLRGFRMAVTVGFEPLCDLVSAPHIGHRGQSFRGSRPFNDTRRQPWTVCGLSHGFTRDYAQARRHGTRDSSLRSPSITSRNSGTRAVAATHTT